MLFRVFCLALLGGFWAYESRAVAVNQSAPANVLGVASDRGAPSLVQEDDGEARSSGEELFGFDEDDYVAASDRLERFDGKIVLKEVRFHGNQVVPTRDLQALAAKYLNRRVGFKGLNALKKEIHALCVERGLLFHRVLLPTQNVRDGDVDFYIRETNIKRISLTADPHVRKRLRCYVDRLRKVRLAKDYERIFLLMQRLSGFVVTAVVSPMKDKPTCLEMHIIVREDKFHAGIGATNTLLKKEVGPWAGNVNFNFDNIIGLNEHWEFTAQATHPFRELLSLSGSLTVPLGSHGLSVTGGWSHFWTEPSLVDKDRKTERRSGRPSSRRRCKLGVSFPFLLRFGKELTGEFAYYDYASVSKVFDPDIPAADRKDPQAEESLKYAFMRAKLRTKFRLGRVSHVILLSGSYQPNKTGGFVESQWDEEGGVSKKVELLKENVKKARALYLSYTMHAALPHNIGLSLLLGGQWSFDERQDIDWFRPVGDSRTTYAYPVGTLVGESGFSARVSASKTFPVSRRVFIAPYVFGSYGSAWLHKKIEGSYGYTDLHSWGLGVECSVASKVSIKGEYAHPLGHMRKPEGQPEVKGEKRFVFSVTMSV